MWRMVETAQRPPGLGCEQGLFNARCAPAASCGDTARGKGMREGAETTSDSKMLILRIPLQFHRPAGRKRLVAPDTSAMVPAIKPQPEGTLEALACAHPWQQRPETGEYGTLAALASAEHISSGAVSRRARATAPTASGRT